MTKTKRDEQALVRIVSRLSKSWRQEAKQAAGELYGLLDEGKNVDTAVRELSKAHPELFKLTGLKDVLVEAAAHGYGIVSSVLTTAEAQAWGKNLSESWDDSRMTLSEKLHGTSAKMREAIIDTVRVQMRKNAAWTKAARELYDGYNSGKAVTMQQALPQYLQTVRRASGGGIEYLRAAREAMRNIDRLARKGAPTKALKAAYQELVDAAAAGSEKELEKACRTAVEEKSRYVADRIIRTEAARAWADGFWASALADDDVVAVKWKLSSRHPVFDLCDMYAKADMYGLGAGIFPKDKVPALPVHPHCLCRMVEIYRGELKGKEKERIREAGDEWLKKLNKVQRERVLGVEGEKAWQEGGDWREYARGWSGLRTAESRLFAMEEQREGRNKSTQINKTYIESGEYRRKFDEITDDPKINRILYQRAKEMLYHRSGTLIEDMDWIDKETGEIIASVRDETKNRKISPHPGIDKQLKARESVIAMHTHPGSMPPSIEDINIAAQKHYLLGIVICHDGKIFVYQAKNTVRVSLYRQYIAKHKSTVYNEYEVQLKALQEIADTGDIILEEVRAT